MRSTRRLLYLACGLACSLSGAAQAVPVYVDHFKDGLNTDGYNARWVTPNHATVGTTPSGLPQFGTFSKDPITLSIDKIPDHQLMVVTLNLYIIGPWSAASGSDVSDVVKPPHQPLADRPAPNQPSIFAVAVDGPAPQFRSSFAMEADGEGRRQSYPDADGIRTHPAGAGALEVATLGYGTLTEPADAVYRICIPVRHSNVASTISFSAENLPAGASWALGAISVEVFEDAGSPPATLAGSTRLDSFDSIFNGNNPSPTGPFTPGSLTGGSGGGGGGGGGPPPGPFPGPGPGPDPSVTVPAPGAAALLGLSGGYLLFHGRRRK